MRLTKKIITISFAVAFCFYCLLAIFFFILFGKIDLIFPWMKPKITYGEFPICLTYELDGTVKTVADVVVCEFDGTYFLSDAGIERKWKTSLKSGNERIVLLDLRALNIKNELEQTILELFFSYGNGQYYMGDTYAIKPQINDYIECKYMNSDGKLGGGAYKAADAYEKFKIRLISWECAPPIENKFYEDI